MKYSRALMLLAGLAAVCASGRSQTPVFSTGQAARLVIGQKNFTSADYTSTGIIIGSPSALAYKDGVLWVSDSNRLGSTPNNNRVLRFSDVSTFPSATQDPTIPGATCGVCRGQASLVLGQPDFISNNSALTPTGLRSPTGIATDGKIIVVADTDNNRVLIWNSLPRVSGQPADVVVGQADFTHNATSVPPTAKSLRGPTGVWLADGKLYVADTQDNRVLIYNNVPTANNAAADVVLGQPNFTSFVQPDLTQNNATPTPTNMQTPVSVTTDATHLFVTDLAQNRILIWNKIPTSNGAAADVAIGQPDLTSAVSNNSFKITDATLDSANNPTGEAGVLCATTGNDSAGNAQFPGRCAATLSLPRYALSDGARLFVADGGNDRVMVYNSIPTASGQPADAILGQPDEFSNNTGQNPNGTDAFQTPVSLAFDGANLYVSDTYNRRVVAYTAGLPNIPLGKVFNAASLNISAIGSVGISGNIIAKDTITITINAKDYTYTVVASDTLASVADALAKKINSAPDGPDPYVIASVNDTTATVVLTARKPGADGANITLASTASSGAQIAGTASGASLNIYLQNPTSIAPGTLIEVNGQNLCDTVAAGAATSAGYLPFTLAGCELYIDGQRTPLLYVSPTQINAQMPVEYTDRSSVSLYARSIHADGSITVTSPVAITIVPQNPGIFALGGDDPRPGLIFHATSNAAAALSIDGAINAGDVATLTIGSTPYAYTVVATDTLTTIRDQFVNLINSDPDASVVATAANEFQRIVLTAKATGAAGESIAIAQTVTGTNASLVITIFNATTCCENTQDALVTTDNPAVPGEILYLFATGLGPTTPSDVDTGHVFQGGSANPPLVPVDSILTGGSAANILTATLVQGLVGVYAVKFQLNTNVATDLATQMTIAQQAFVSNVVTFPVVAPPTATTSSAAKPARKPRAR